MELRNRVIIDLENIERMRVEKVKSDKQKLMDFSARIKALETPVVYSPEAKDVLIDVLNYLSFASVDIEDFCEGQK